MLHRRFHRLQNPGSHLKQRCSIVGPGVISSSEQAIGAAFEKGFTPDAQGHVAEAHLILNHGMMAE